MHLMATIIKASVNVLDLNRTMIIFSQLCTTLLPPSHFATVPNWGNFVLHRSRIETGRRSESPYMTSALKERGLEEKQTKDSITG